MSIPIDKLMEDCEWLIRARSVEMSIDELVRWFGLVFIEEVRNMTNEEIKEKLKKFYEKN